jgi:hypothetical protein
VLAGAVLLAACTRRAADREAGSLAPVTRARRAQSAARQLLRQLLAAQPDNASTRTLLEELESAAGPE